MSGRIKIAKISRPSAVAAAATEIKTPMLMMMRPLAVAATVVHVWSACYIDDGTFAAALYGSQTTSSSRVNCIYDDLITDGNSLPVITTANSSYGPRNPTGTRIGASSVCIYPATTFIAHQMILLCRPSCVYLCTAYTLSRRSRWNIIAGATGWEDRRFY